MNSSIKIKQLEKVCIYSAAVSPPLPRVSSPDLLGPRGELIIDHNGREYRLRLTQNGKLILTA